MVSSPKIYLLILLYALANLSVTSGEIILTEDNEYEVIKFKIPQDVWQKAIHPTPILKSSVTVTLPVSLSGENVNEVDYEEEAQEATELSVAEISEASVAEPSQPTVPAADEPVVDEEPGTITSPQNPNPILGQIVRFPCSCLEGQCGCCTGTILERINMKACGNVSFIPEDFVFDVRMSVNNNTVVRQRVSASDPPPICFNPRRVPFVQVCAEISNIRIRNRNAFACLDINANIGGFPVYSAPFRCFGLGTSGVQTNLKPKPQTSNGPKPINLFGNGGDSDSGGFLENAAETILGGDGPVPNRGPLAALGNAVGGIFETRNHLRTKLGDTITHD